MNSKAGSGITDQFPFLLSKMLLPAIKLSFKEKLSTLTGKKLLYVTELSSIQLLFHNEEINYPHFAERQQPIYYLLTCR
jgi:hypothetical protein